MNSSEDGMQLSACDKPSYMLAMYYADCGAKASLPPYYNATFNSQPRQAFLSPLLL